MAEFFDLSWWAVKSIDKRYLTGKLGPVDLSGVDVFAMDEFAIQKGHRNATVIVEPRTKLVLWGGRSCSRESIWPFFRLLGKGGCRRHKAVAIDMNRAYEMKVKAHCPQAEIVFDIFHVVAKYGREVVDAVRRDEVKRVPGTKSTQGDQGLALAAAEEQGQHHEPGGPHSAARPAGGQPKPDGGLRAQGGPQAALAVPLPRWRYASDVAGTIGPCVERHRTSEAFRQTPMSLPAWYHGPLPLSAAHQPAEGNQQQDQGYQTYGLWFQR